MPAAGDLLAVLTPAGRFDSLSPSWEQVLGWAPQQLAEEPFADLVHPRDRVRATAALERVASEPGDVRFEARLRAADGLYRPLDLHCWAHDGALLISARDVTEQRLVEGRLRTVERELRTRMRHNELLAQLGQHGLTGADVVTVTRQAAEMVAHTLNADHVAVFQVLPDGSGLRLIAGVGWDEGEVGHQTVGAGRRSQSGFTLLSERPVIVTDFRTERRFDRPLLVLQHGILSGISVVIPGGLNPFGVLAVGTTAVRRFRQDEVALLETVANVVAATVQRRQSEEALRRSEEQFRSAFDDASIGMAVVDVGSPEPVFMAVNSALTEMTGYTREHLMGSRFADFMGDDDFPSLDEPVTGTFPRYRRERRYSRADGTSGWMLLNISVVHDAEGEPLHAIAHMEDITVRKTAEEKLTQLALHDALTGLANRRLLLDRLEHALAQLSRTAATVAVFYVDLDRFKPINDRFGHAMGDRLLQEVARRLTRSSRPSDTVARVGGDEFVLVCELDDDTHVAVVARRIEGAICEPLEIDGQLLSVSASIGVAVGHATDEASQLLDAADAAMYRAKTHRSGTYEIYGDELRTQADERLRVEQNLRDALDGGRLTLHYQPVIELGSGRVHTVEALLRLTDPADGLLLPRQFLDVAEDSGLILAIGGWVLEQACHQQVRWRRELAEPPSVSVNISARQVAGGGFADMVGRTLAMTGADASLLALEFTEPALDHASAPIRQELDGLRAQGVRVVLDNFGTGASSLTLLQQLPLDGLKVERALVFGDGSGRPDVGPAITALGRSLRLTVVAEGVEQEEDLAVLRDVGWDQAQGYSICPPLPAEAMTAYLATAGGA